MGDEIRSVRYRSGLTTDVQHLDGVSGVELRNSDIPPDIVGAIEDDGILRLAGTWGDPALGTPVEVDDLIVETDGGTTRIRVHNRSIHMLGTDDERLTGTHRVCCMLQRFLPKREHAGVQIARDR
jgi:hypothetical protein